MRDARGTTSETPLISEDGCSRASSVGSGVGASVCANKIAGVRAALIHDHFSARQGVEDDHLNVLCMGGRTVGPAVAWDLVQTFLDAEFSQGSGICDGSGKWQGWNRRASAEPEGSERWPPRSGTLQ